MTRSGGTEQETGARTSSLRHELLNHVAAAASLASVAARGDDAERAGALERLPVELAIVAVLVEDAFGPATAREPHPVPVEVASVLRAAAARFGAAVDAGGTAVEVVADTDALEHVLARMLAFALALTTGGVSAAAFERLESAGIEIRLPAPTWLRSDPGTVFDVSAGSEGHRPGLAPVNEWAKASGGEAAASVDGEDLVLRLELPRARS